MKPIIERYFEMHRDPHIYYTTKSIWNTLNKEYFKGKLKIKIEHTTKVIIPYNPTGMTEHFDEFTINERIFRWRESLDYLQSLYELQCIKKKINNINEH